MPAAAKAKRHDKSRHLKLTSPPEHQDPHYSWAYACAADSSERAQIHRSLEDDNRPGGPNDTDPKVSVFFTSTAKHPGDDPYAFGDGWQEVRWSAVNEIIDGLLKARDAAVRTGMLPKPREG